jgi:surface polysaccharide O-acyltransferase-like enzyme
MAPMAGVVIVHSIYLTQPGESVGANAVLMFLHTNRELFFFVTGFVLSLSTRFWERPIDRMPFWRKRFPPVLFPYLLWTLIYWITDLMRFRPDVGLALWWLGGDLWLGWFDLYFLLVTVSAAIELGITAVMQYLWPSTPGWVQWWFSSAQVEATSYQLFFIVGAVCAAHFDEVRAWIKAHQPATLLLALAGGVVGEGWYFVNLALGQPPGQAANVLQPPETLLVGTTLVSLWVLAEWAVEHFSPTSLVWRALGFAADASFGVFLMHMLVLTGLYYTPLYHQLGFDRLPSPVATLLTILIGLVVTGALVALLRHLPLALLTTGRPRRAWPRVVRAAT